MAREILGAAGLWGNSRSLAKGNSRATGSGESRSQPVIWATGSQARLLAPEGGRAAQRTLRNRRDGSARPGEAAASHTCSGLVLLCPTGQNRTHRHAAAAIPTDGSVQPGSAAVVRFEGADIAGPLRRHGRAGGKLACLPYRGDERHSRPVRQVHVRGGVEQHQVRPGTWAKVADVVAA